MSANLLRDALRDAKFLNSNYGVQINLNDTVYSILCAFTAYDICRDYLEFKGER